MVFALSVVVVVSSIVLGSVAALTLCWMVYAWRSPAGLAGTRFSRGEPTAVRRLRFSLLVPARHEDAVLGGTLDSLAALDHASFEILCIVGHDDPGTTAVATEAARRHPGRVRVVVDHSWPKNKPSALNTALPHCTGDIVGVFDAEDEVAPGLLSAIEATFHHDRADVVQGGVQLMNIHSSWWSLRNCLEYFFWFRSRLHYHADRDFIPLGGNTVFVRTDLLRAVDGWDPTCLAEDCELGVRLSSLGAWVSVAYEPSLATREETPGSIRSLVKQRTRWNQGFLQVLRKGTWRGLATRRQRALARYTLVTPFLQAATGLLVPVSLLLMFTAHTPALVTLTGFLPLLLVVASVAIEAVGLHEFGRDFHVPVRRRDYLILILGTVPFQWLLAVAAVRAVLRELQHKRGWEKTSHSGAHRGSTSAPSALTNATGAS
ncbi:MAG: glycosyl transferase [Frankiales bacterium]|nr:glycosyl transferase [Frankiales bacterium]